MLSARRWLTLWQRLGAGREADSALAATFAALADRYAEPHRHYHTARHVAECLEHFDSVCALCEHEAEVELALWFHDAIYDPRSKSNEAQSANWAQRVMRKAGLPDDCCSRVHALILKTCHDAQSETIDQQVLVDIDLAILGADTQRFGEYERQVRAEYAWVPESLFRRTRKQILEGFLTRPTIYSTALFRTALENSARANLSRSLQLLC